MKLLNLDSCLNICDMYWMAFVPAVNISHTIMPNDQTSVLKVMHRLSVLPEFHHQSYLFPQETLALPELPTHRDCDQ